MLWYKLKKYLTDKDYLRDQIKELLISDMNQNKQSAFEKERLQEQISKGKEEQDRYAKAYGAATLDFEQFKELMKESKRKVESLEKRQKELTEITNNEVVNTEHLDLFCDEAGRVVDNLNFDDKKRLVGDIIDNVTVDENGHVETRGHLYLFANSWDSKMNVTQELGLYATSRNRRTGKRWEEHAF